MTSAQARAIRELDEALAECRAERAQLHDLLLAVLAKEGGVIRIPEGLVMTARRQAIVHDVVDGDLVVMTQAYLDHESKRPGFLGMFGRLKRIASRG